MFPLCGISRRHALFAVIEAAAIEKDCISNPWALALRRGVEWSMPRPVMALVRKNGAGKSIDEVLTGDTPGCRPLLWSGKDDLHTAQTQEAGIGIIHQELNLIPSVDDTLKELPWPRVHINRLAKSTGSRCMPKPTSYCIAKLNTSSTSQKNWWAIPSIGDQWEIRQKC